SSPRSWRNASQSAGMLGASLKTGTRTCSRSINVSAHAGGHMGSGHAECLAPADLPFDRPLEPILEVDARLEAEERARPRDVGDAPHDVLVLAEGLVGNELDLRRRVAADEPPDELREVEDGDLARVAEVEDHVVRGVLLERSHDAVHVVAHVGEGARLLA